MAAVEDQHNPPSRAIGVARLVIGLAQGLALYLLYLAYDRHGWPATDANLFGPLLVVALFVPLLATQALGNVRITTLVAWIVAATVILAGLSWYDVWSAWPTDWNYNQHTDDLHIMPSFRLFGFVVIGLFIAQALIEGDAERKLIANYHTHFDVAWKLALQLALAGVFLGVFWGLLWLGAALFELIQLDFLERLLEHEWFSIPATTLSVAVAIHVTDVRAGLVRGTRTLVLTLLSWLLPLLTVLIAAFLAALVFTGLQPLWDTRHAAGVLMFATLMLLLLVNATYQDGNAERRPAAVLRYAGLAAAIAMVPLVAISAYAIMLRVQQYGWTDDRIISAAAAAILAFYAIGYAWAAFPNPEWLKRIERWNFYASLLVLAALVLLLSPIASPTRLSVGSQVARVESGTVDAEHFDFDYLRFEGGRYGREALIDLAAHATGPNAAAVKERAGMALKEITRSYGEVPQEATRPLRDIIHVHPAGATLPEEFLSQNWNTDPQVGLLPGCLFGRGECDAVVTDLDGDGAADVLLYEYSSGTVFKRRAEGGWQKAGTIRFPGTCPKLRDAIVAGRFQAEPTTQPAWRDLVVDGHRVTIENDGSFGMCPD